MPRKKRKRGQFDLTQEDSEQRNSRKRQAAASKASRHANRENPPSDRQPQTASTSSTRRPLQDETNSPPDLLISDLTDLH
ncbi:hypothetical protein ABBQ32_000840 [Trebouxia sp. C0010 RCD-2024]